MLTTLDLSLGLSPFQGIVSRAEQAFGLNPKGYNLYIVIANKSPVKELGESDLAVGVPFIIANYDSFKAYRNVMVNLAFDSKNRKVINLCITPKEYTAPIKGIATDCAQWASDAAAAANPAAAAAVIAAITAACNPARSLSLGTALDNGEVDAIRRAHIGSLSSLHPGLPEIIAARPAIIEAQSQARREVLATQGKTCEDELFSASPPVAQSVLPPMPGAMPANDAAKSCTDVTTQTAALLSVTPSAAPPATASVDGGHSSAVPTQNGEAETYSSSLYSCHSDHIWKAYKDKYGGRSVPGPGTARRSRPPSWFDKNSTPLFSFGRPPPPTNASVRIFGNGAVSASGTVRSSASAHRDSWRASSADFEGFRSWGNKGHKRPSPSPAGYPEHFKCGTTIANPRENPKAEQVGGTPGVSVSDSNAPPAVTPLAAAASNGPVPTNLGQSDYMRCYPTTSRYGAANCQNQPARCNSTIPATSTALFPGQANKYDSLKSHVDKFVFEFNNTLADMFGVPFTPLEKGEKDTLVGEGEKDTVPAAVSVKENKNEAKAQHKATCDMCGVWIAGVRHKCLECPDWCAQCSFYILFTLTWHLFS